MNIKHLINTIAILLCIVAVFGAVMFGLNGEQLVAWLVSGISFDIIHGIGNFVAGLLILPVSEFLKKLFGKTKMYL